MTALAIAAAASLLAGFGGCAGGGGGVAFAPPPIALEVTAPEPGYISSVDEVTVSGTVTPPDADVEVNGEPFVVSDGQFEGSASIGGDPGEIRLVVEARVPGYLKSETVDIERSP